ncbi:MAG TPA: ATP-dependent helicase, partial [Candidatus Limnocylindria bacterium]|nr:ATP-dependent helicase [Candidatus Limnocylindria bacterium]
MVLQAAPTLDAEPILAALDPEQRAAALLPNGPALIIAPAGSGKTNTLVARLGVLVSRGVEPERIGVVTFNREAAGELSARIGVRLGSLPGVERIEVRTLHAMARQVLLDTGRLPDLVADRGPLLRQARREAGGSSTPDVQRLDTELSAWKVEGREPSEEARPVLDALQSLLTARGALDFDDLVTGAARALERDPALRTRWQARFSHLCVDEFQDVDAAQLRLVRLLAAPENNLFVVGDDDQTIYAWRLADVRRILGFAGWYPGTRQVILATNYRCPPGIVAAGRRLIEHNAERFAKPIRAGREGSGDEIAALATVGSDWPRRLVALAAGEVAAGGRACFLARTRSELVPVLVALALGGHAHHSPVPAPIEAEPVRELLTGLESSRGAREHPFTALRRLRHERGWDRADLADELGEEAHAALDALIGWAVGFDDADAFLAAATAMRERVRELRRPHAPIELLTAHGAKGREWPLVILVGFEAERFPNRRALRDALDPQRAMEEERRLAYVAVTRATRRLVLAFDPARPSPFLAEMGYRPTSG